MPEWPDFSLGEVVEIAVGPAFKSAEFTDDGSDVPLLRGVNVGVGAVSWSATKYWPKDRAAEVDRFRLGVGDIVLAMDRPWIDAGLKVACIRSNDAGSLLVQRVARLRALPHADQAFLRGLVGTSAFAEYLRSVAGGVTVPHISARQICDFRFRLPPLAVQRRIGAALRVFDELIAINERRIAILAGLARSLYREWFVRLRFPGHSAATFYDTPAGRIPEGWVAATTGDFLQLLGGGTPSKERHEYWTHGTIDWFTPSDLTHARTRFVDASATRITELGLSSSSARLFGEQSVLMTSRATLGVLAVAAVEAACNQGFIVVLPHADLSSSFIYDSTFAVYRPAAAHACWTWAICAGAGVWPCPG